MSGTVWTKFYWSDWLSDSCLRVCSLPARGLWMDMLCIAAQSDPIGYLAVNAHPLTVHDIARMVGGSAPEVETLIEELDRNGVLSRDRTGTIYNRRLVRDAKKSRESRKNGKLGGNPSLRKDSEKPQGVNPTLMGRLKPHIPLTTYQEPKEKKELYGSSRAMNPENEAAFEEFWKVYPKRDGASPKAPAKVRFLSAVMRGADPPMICAAAGRYAAECRRLGTEKTTMVAQAVTWLTQRRWEDYPEAIPVDTPTWAPPPGMKSLKEEWANDSTADIRVDAGSRQNGSNRVEQLQLPGGGSLRVEVRPEGKSPGDPPW